MFVERVEGKRNIGAAGLLCLALLGVAGCKQQAATPAKPESYPVHGRVVSVDAAGQDVVLNHEAIPGLMEAMTMEYHVADTAALGEMHPGDRIVATMLADRDSEGPKNLRLTDVVVVGQARPGTKAPVVYHVPSAGEALPNFTLLDQSGKTLRTDQFHGKVVALTFIYTRCPLADYCPRMSRNFLAIDDALKEDPALYAQTHMLSVSFDPTYDTPKVLRSYGGGVTGQYTKETFAHWSFAAPVGDDLLAMEKWFAVGVTPGEKGTLTHSLATAVIGKDGKVVAFWPSNDWAVQDVLAAMKNAAKS